MYRFYWLLLLVFFGNSVNGQGNILPKESDSSRLVSLSNLKQDDRTMIALTFGQSNASNRGQTPYTPTNTSSVFNYYNGKLYTAKDPLIGTTGNGGSVWTHLADTLINSGLYDKVILIPIAVGGAAIERWSSGDCSKILLQTLQSLTSQHIHLTHILWHQGETDNLLNTPAETYKERLNTILNTIRSYHQDADLYVSLASYHPSSFTKPLGVDKVIRKAQKEFINERKRVLLGPDTDVLIHAIYRYDSVHFSDFGLKAFADLWFSALKKKSERT
ncbi:sialate O-acetylesterase [Pedobacter nyackensis]|uniref:sialate O-acetylesterase n=1 Tax=Pedobacter nyackensis TaxID=475255 RepID=UPI00292E3F25|nr:sialate O-acetylesterase [Pedobacter nyackensis]